jgi:hypothetical protein
VTSIPTGANPAPAPAGAGPSALTTEDGKAAPSAVPRLAATEAIGR